MDSRTAWRKSFASQLRVGWSQCFFHRVSQHIGSLPTPLRTPFPDISAAPHPLSEFPRRRQFDTFPLSVLLYHRVSGLIQNRCMPDRSGESLTD